MRSMKSSIYRYARRQAHREFNRAYYQYRNGKSVNKVSGNVKGVSNNANPEFSDTDIIIGTCVVIGIIFFFAVALSL